VDVKVQLTNGMAEVKAFKRLLMQYCANVISATTPHDRPGTLIVCKKSLHNSDPTMDAKCRWPVERSPAQTLY